MTFSSEFPACNINSNIAYGNGEISNYLKAVVTTIGSVSNTHSMDT